MRPLARRRLAWWDSLVCALVLLGVISALLALVLLAQWAGRRAILPALGAIAMLFAFTVQSIRLRTALAFVGGWLLHG